MSGIVGIYNIEGDLLESSYIRGMLNGIAHRGADGDGAWNAGSVALGHQMLRTTPESLNEKLPFREEAGNLTITADARIDNRNELISALHINGWPAGPVADSEIILAAYKKWGERCPEKLLGDFAFAIWDGEKRRLFCARDPVGIKPFYYNFDGKTFRFASEPRGILGDKTVSKEPNLPMIFRFFLDRFDGHEQTLYKNIYRLPSSHSMIVEKGGLRKYNYWDIDPEKKIRYRTDEEYSEHFLSLFKDSVKACLRSYGRVGATLSGGLDSSSITCVAREVSQEGSFTNLFETFSILYGELPCDESHYIEKVVGDCGIRANYFLYKDYLAWLDFDQTQKYGDVFYWPMLYIFGPVFKAAQDKGIRIMLDGLGGDDLFSVDFDHLTDYLLQGNFPKLLQQLYWDAKTSSYPITSLFLRYCLKPMIPQFLKMPLKSLLRTYRSNEIPAWINHSLLKDMDLELSRSNDFDEFPTYSQRRIYRGLRWGWNTNVVMDTLERYSNYFSIENRHPFFARPLIEFVIAVPEEQRWDKGYPKILLRRATKGIMPDFIRERKDKPHFSWVIDFEIKERHNKKVEYLIETSQLSRHGIIFGEKLKEVFRKYSLQITPDWAARRHLEGFVWLELWFRSAITA